MPYATFMLNLSPHPFIVLPISVVNCLRQQLFYYKILAQNLGEQDLYLAGP